MRASAFQPAASGAVRWIEVPISRQRKRAVNGLLFMVLGASLYCIAADTEYWPFSQYPMYSTIVHPGVYTDLTLVGVTATAPSRELSLTEDKYLIPFDWVRLREALTRLEAGPDHQARLAAALRGCWRRYGDLRRAGRHHGPPLAMVRLSRQTWEEVGPGAPSVETSTAHTALVAEVHDLGSAERQ